MYENISFVMPYKFMKDREELFNFAKDRITILFPEAEKIISVYNKEPFSRGKALNNGVKIATRDIIVMVDADIIFDKELIDRSVEELNKSTWIVPFTNYMSVIIQDTSRILDCKPDLIIKSLNSIYASVFTHTLGAMNIIKRKDFLEIGGFDERLVGWGYDDNVFAHIADVMIGKHKRVDGNVYHLYHAGDRNSSNPNTKANKKIYEEIKTITDKEIMKEYLKVRYESKVITCVNE
jgi:predicted glycosyltransferase involved in capsule biosynthesis